MSSQYRQSRSGAATIFYALLCLVSIALVPQDTLAYEPPPIRVPEANPFDSPEFPERPEEGDRHKVSVVSEDDDSGFLVTIAEWFLDWIGESQR